MRSGQNRCSSNDESGRSDNCCDDDAQGSDPPVHVPVHETKLSLMTPRDFKRLALSFHGAEEGSHMGAVDFRIGGRIFATLASVRQGYGNLMLTPEQQTQFVEGMPDVFLPVAGGWGRMGATHVRLAVVTEDVLKGALQVAWKLRVEENERARPKRTRTPRR
ncbi:MAG TPA: MmcQ/YjbR family DNA-binding protein [Vicinamibacterales bacterium]|nr:MmcQ/YjbR family DNA-binding protein [Vicinamibacterales bacterium]